eukprot:CAMPEP_0117668716 /NCGR_PEP_ID=MMETSP0804-20121206/11707_1 /TAXON_ID=1074897 /ORGANISM="Tetraselmis astigmatica, Strain CCMP880" /LENGTH=570 /DNA_ID=CAMNT_0005476645 /DNA_START=87 /DNA_END=1796 /DNA_ORIENTATION=+
MGKRERQREKKRKATISSRKSRSASLKPKTPSSIRSAGKVRANDRWGPDICGGPGSSRPYSAGRALTAAKLPYSSGQRLLVLGDGDFSFSAGLATRLGKPGCCAVLATSFDSQKEVLEKYGGKAKSCLDKLHKMGTATAHSVDATKLSATLPPSPATPQRFDAVIFNFPHTGSQMVHLNREMLRRFFASVQRHLKPAGEVHVTIKTVPPYSRWDIPAQAAQEGLKLTRKAPFLFQDYPGYQHRTTEKDAMTFDAFEKKCVTFVFAASALAMGALPPTSPVEQEEGAASPGDREGEPSLQHVREPKNQKKAKKRGTPEEGEAVGSDVGGGCEEANPPSDKPKAMAPQRPPRNKKLRLVQQRQERMQAMLLAPQETKSSGFSSAQASVSAAGQGASWAAAEPTATTCAQPHSTQLPGAGRICSPAKHRPAEKRKVPTVLEGGLHCSPANGKGGGGGGSSSTGEATAEGLIKAEPGKKAKAKGNAKGKLNAKGGSMRRVTGKSKLKRASEKGVKKGETHTPAGAAGERIAFKEMIRFEADTIPVIEVELAANGETAYWSRQHCLFYTMHRRCE